MSKPRHELKYFINTADYLAIKNIIKYIRKNIFNHNRKMK